MAAEPVRYLTKSLLGSRFVHPDHLGTPRVITASTALAATTGTGITSPQTVNKAVWRWDSDPFGSNATANSAPNENPNTLSQVVGTATLPYLFGFDLAFPGQKRDRETGKHYNYFRDYDPAVGRYVESDPIGLKGGINTFGYALQRPAAVYDPRGGHPVILLFLAERGFACLTGCFTAMMGQMAKCCKDECKGGFDLSKCDPRKSKCMNICNSLEACATGCIVGFFLPTPLAGAAGFGLGLGAKAAFRALFGFNPCEKYDLTDPSAK